MTEEIKPIWKTKTFWAAGAGILTAVGCFFAGEIDILGLIQAGLPLLAIIFLRTGLVKVK